MKIVSATSPKNRLLFLYAILLTAAFITLLLFDKLPQRLYKRFTGQTQSAFILPIETPHYQAKTAVYSLLNTHDKVVFVGNSITENCDWNELLQTDKIANRGIGGDRTAGILQRIELYLADTPRCIVLMDGINDVLQGVPYDSIVANYKTTIAKVKAANIPLVIESVLFTAEHYQDLYSSRQVNEVVSKLNAFLSNYCTEQRIQFVDLNMALSQSGYLHQEYTVSDGLHLSRVAYQKMKETIEPALREYL